MSKDITYQITGIVLDEGMGLTLGELCQLCKANAEQIMAMVDEGLVAPRGSHRQDWHFDGTSVKRVQIALRLQQDLNVNLAGAALVLDLLEELQELRRWRHCQSNF
jgi:chaperone modulatory protein CbpM